MMITNKETAKSWGGGNPLCADNIGTEDFKEMEKKRIAPRQEV